MTTPIYRFGVNEKPQPKAAHAGDIPPHNLDAERGVVASLLLDADFLADFAAQAVSASEFFGSAHQLVVAAILALHARGEPADEITVPAELHKRGELQAVGGPSGFNEITRGIEVTANAPAWLSIVRDCAIRRSAILAASRLKDAARAPHPIAHAADAIARDLAELVAPSSGPVIASPAGFADFPTEVFPTSVSDLVRFSANANQVSCTMPALCALGVASAALGKVGAANPKSHRISRANLFIVGVAEQGTGKGETFRHFLPPLEAIEKREVDKWERQAAEWRGEINRLTGVNPAKGAQKKKYTEIDTKGTAFIHKFEAGGSEEQRLEELNQQLKNGTPCYIAEDMTAEKMETILAANKGELFVASSEAKRVFENIGGRNNRNAATGSDDSDLWCKVWAGDPLNIQRMSRSVRVEDPRVAMLAFVQGDLAERFRTNKEFYSRGLLARILFADTFAEPAFIDPDKGLPKIPSESFDAWREVIEDLHACAHDGKSRTMRFSDAAARRFIALHNEQVAHRKAGHVDGAAVRIRRTMQAERIAVVLHAMTHRRKMFSVEISLETAEAACRVEMFFRQFQERILAAHAKGGRNDRFAKVVDFLRENGPASANQIRKAAGLSAATKAGELIEAMLADGVIRQDGSKTYSIK